MVESKFQSKVLNWLKDMGLYAVKYNASAISKTGVPDVLLNLCGSFMAIELKRDNKSKPTELQKWNINKINREKGIACVLRPDKFDLFKDIVRWYLTDSTTNNKRIFKHRIITEIGIE